MKSSAGKGLPSKHKHVFSCRLSPRTACNVQESVLYDCTPDHAFFFDNSLLYLNSSTGTRSLEVTLQNHETRLSGIVGSKLHISGWFSKIT